MLNTWVAVALKDDEIAFAGVGTTPELATAALETDMRFGWSNLFDYEQKEPPYYGKFESFVGNYDVMTPQLATVKATPTPTYVMAVFDKDDLAEPLFSTMGTTAEQAKASLLSQIRSLLEDWKLLEDRKDEGDEYAVTDESAKDWLNDGENVIVGPFEVRR